MSFVNGATVNHTATLKGAHYAFPRAKLLREGMTWMITDYYAKMSLSQPFEARGLLVTGPSRSGKSTEIRKLLSEVNSGDTMMPDGRPAKIASVILKGSLTWKDLGMYTLHNGLKYPATGRLTQREVWERVVLQAKLQGVVGIHYDECQHIFPQQSGDSSAKILDSFKSLLKQSEWPLMLILSGVESLARHITQEEQLAYLLRPLAFSEISMANKGDQSELHTLCHAYAQKAELDLGGLPSHDFYNRLAIAGAFRWGLVIELLIDACILALSKGRAELSVSEFCQAFTDATGLRPGYSPFLIDDYEVLFEAKKIFALWEGKRI